MFMIRTTPHTRRFVALVIFALAPAMGHAKPDWAAFPIGRDPNEKLAPCDWLEVYAKAERGSLKIAYRCVEPVNFDRAAPYCIFFDVDAFRGTGFRGGSDEFPIGADYLLQGATLYRYGGADGEKGGTAWSWSEVGAVGFSLDKEWADIAITKEQMPVTANTFHLFLYGDNTAEGVGGKANDLLPNDALRAGGGGGFLKVKTR